MPPSAAQAALKPQARSRLSNGSALLPGVDGRSTWARRLRDLIGTHIADLGGEGAVSAAVKSLVRRACTLTVELEILEARFAQAGQATADELERYSRVSGNLRRMFETLGLERRAKEVPTLTAYLASKATQTAADESEVHAASAAISGANERTCDVPSEFGADRLRPAPVPGGGEPRSRPENEGTGSPPLVTREGGP